jgi:pre-mRNA-splicing factor CDC5/CEF1
MRTPRDNFAINADGDMQLVGATPRDIKLREMAMKHQLRQGLASLPKPKDTEWELELPEEQQEVVGTEELSEEDAELRDRRNREIREAQELLESKRRTQVLQRGLPRPAIVDINKMLKDVSELSDPKEIAIAQEMALLIANDAVKYPTSNMKVKGAAKPLEVFEDDTLARARLEIAMQLPKDMGAKGDELFEKAWKEVHTSSLLPGLIGYGDDEDDEQELMTKAFDVCTASP